MRYYKFQSDICRMVFHSRFANATQVLLFESNE